MSLPGPGAPAGQLLVINLRDSQKVTQLMTHGMIGPMRSLHLIQGVGYCDNYCCYHVLDSTTELSSLTANGSNFAELGTEEDNWADDDEWERNWNEQVEGAGSTAVKSRTVGAKSSGPSASINVNDFESYNPLSSVKAKPKSADDDLWDLLNN